MLLLFVFSSSGLVGRTLSERGADTSRAATLSCAKRHDQVQLSAYYGAIRAKHTHINEHDTDTEEPVLSKTQEIYAESCQKLRVKPVVQLMQPTTSILLLRFQRLGNEGITALAEALRFEKTNNTI